MKISLHGLNLRTSKVSISKVWLMIRIQYFSEQVINDYKRRETKGISKHQLEWYRFKAHKRPIIERPNKPENFFPINTVDLYIFHNKEKEVKI